MAFKNEHSARLRDPWEFKKFARANDRGGLGIDFIFGMKQGSSFIQAIRFDKKLFTVEQAKAWLKQSGFPVIKFEPAKEGKSKMRKNPVSANSGITKDGIMYEKLFPSGMWAISDGTFRMRYGDYSKKEAIAMFRSDRKKYREGIITRKNPADALKPVDLEAWLTASYYEEEKGVKDYMRLLERIKDVPEYSGVRSVVKKIIKDEKKHLKMIARVLGA